MFRVSEVQAVRCRQRPAAGADDIAARFGDSQSSRLHADFGRRDSLDHRVSWPGLFRAFDSNNSGIRTRSHHRVGLHHVVVLFPYPLPARKVRRRDGKFQKLCSSLDVPAKKRVDQRRFAAVKECKVIESRRERRFRRQQGPLIDRRFVGESADSGFPRRPCRAGGRAEGRRSSRGRP